MEHQNDSTVLYETQNGYVLEYKCCGDIQVTFENIKLVYNQKGFNHFKSIIDGVDYSNITRELPYHRNIHIKLHPLKMGLTLNIEELSDLLRGAQATMKLNKIVNDAYLGAKR